MTKMRIAILGTKGIPNNYGGYEQFAEFISSFLERGHSVTVYNPHYHPYQEAQFKGVNIIRKYSPEKTIGGAANVIYDFLCLRDALKRNFDVIYEAGYHSVAPAYKFLNVRKRKKPVIITNMDGLEYKRSKWSKSVQQIIENLERIAVKHSPYLISDNLGIYDYLKNKYGTESFYLPYGADPIESFDDRLLKEYNVQAEKYFMLIARIEPENNIETVIQGHLNSTSGWPLLVVGNPSTKFGQYLTRTYTSDKVRFTGGIYNKTHLDSLRHFSLGYFHGHSVGGTNPSLLEAMGSQTFIIAHDNSFNGAILGSSALYFKHADDARHLIETIVDLRNRHRNTFLTDNLQKIKTLYNWDVIVDQHEKLFLQLIESSQTDNSV
jgi:glycosyltransferase involved in cell wall biosynthesis